MTIWPKITVVTPTKNSEDYLKETIESVLGQDYPNLEYVIIDGRSTDGTLNIIKGYEKYLAYWESSPDRSMYDAVAKGFEKATGEILAWINSDDLYEPGALLRVGKHFAENPCHHAVFFEDTVEKDGWRFANRAQPSTVGLGELLSGHILYQDGVFFSKSAYESVGGLNRDLKYAGDFDLWLRLSRHLKFHKLKGHASCFRIRSNQLSMSDWQRYIDECNKCIEAFSGTLSKKEIFFAKAAATLNRNRHQLEKRLRRRFWPLERETEPWPPIIKEKEYHYRDCACPVCGEKPKRLLFSTPDTRFGDKHLWRLYECSDCNLAFTFPKPADSFLAVLYERYYSGCIKGVHTSLTGYASLYKGRGGHTFAALRQLRHLCPVISRTVGILYDDIVPVDEDLGARILEVGCFEGRILEHLRAKGYKNLYGIELNKKAASVASSKGFEVNCEDVAVSDWPHVSVDALILNQVLEHVREPVGFLRSVSRLLKKNGSIYLSLPNYDSAFAEIYGPVWAHWHIPYHFFIPSPMTVKKIAASVGLGVSWLKTSTPVHYAYMTHMLSVVGLAGFVSHNIDSNDSFYKQIWKWSTGVTAFSRLFLDPFLKGDCLYAKLIKKDIFL